MYCYHCGKYFNEKRIEKKNPSLQVKDANGVLVEIDSDAKVEYVCPQCGHLTHADGTPEEVKSLSQAAHSQLQRGANSFARGMAFNLLGIIIGILALSFLLLSYQNVQGAKVLNTTKSTFLVFAIMGAVAVILLAFGIFSTIIGVEKRVRYTKLLKDLNNKTFIQ